MKVYLPLDYDSTLRAIRRSVKKHGSGYVRCFELEEGRIGLRIRFLGESRLIFKARETDDGGTTLKLEEENLKVHHRPYRQEVRQTVTAIVEDLGGWAL